MGWDSVERSPADPESQDRERREEQLREVRRVLRGALENPNFKTYLTHIALGGSYTPGQSDQTAYREGIRALAVKLLTMGENPQ